MGAAVLGAAALDGHDRELSLEGLHERAESQVCHHQVCREEGGQREVDAGLLRRDAVGWAVR